MFRRFLVCVLGFCLSGGVFVVGVSAEPEPVYQSVSGVDDVCVSDFYGYVVSVEALVDFGLILDEGDVNYDTGLDIGELETLHNDKRFTGCAAIVVEKLVNDRVLFDWVDTGTFFSDSGFYKNIVATNGVIDDSSVNGLLTYRDFSGLMLLDWQTVKTGLERFVAQTNNSLAEQEINNSFPNSLMPDWYISFVNKIYGDNHVSERDIGLTIAACTHINDTRVCEDFEYYRTVTQEYAFDTGKIRVPQTLSSRPITATIKPGVSILGLNTASRTIKPATIKPATIKPGNIRPRKAGWFEAAVITGMVLHAEASRADAVQAQSVLLFEPPDLTKPVPEKLERRKTEPIIFDNSLNETLTINPKPKQDNEFVSPPPVTTITEIPVPEKHLNQPETTIPNTSSTQKPKTTTPTPLTATTPDPNANNPNIIKPETTHTIQHNQNNKNTNSNKHSAQNNTNPQNNAEQTPRNNAGVTEQSTVQGSPIELAGLKYWVRVRTRTVNGELSSQVVDVTLASSIQPQLSCETIPPDKQYPNSPAAQLQEKFAYILYQSGSQHNAVLDWLRNYRSGRGLDQNATIQNPIVGNATATTLGASGIIADDAYPCCESPTVEARNELATCTNCNSLYMPFSTVNPDPLSYPIVQELLALGYSPEEIVRVNQTKTSDPRIVLKINTNGQMGISWQGKLSADKFNLVNLSEDLVKYLQSGRELTQKIITSQNIVIIQSDTTIEMMDKTKTLVTLPVSFQLSLNPGYRIPTYSEAKTLLVASAVFLARKAGFTVQCANSSCGGINFSVDKKGDFPQCFVCFRYHFQTDYEPSNLAAGEAVIVHPDSDAHRISVRRKDYEVEISLSEHVIIIEGKESQFRSSQFGISIDIDHGLYSYFFQSSHKHKNPYITLVRKAITSEEPSPNPDEETLNNLLFNVRVHLGIDPNIPPSEWYLHINSD